MDRQLITGLEPTFDVVVVGARIAGAATAMLLARRGLRVALIDRSRLGADTLSTHAFMRPGVLQLHRWGLLDQVRAAGTPPVHRTTFRYADDVVPVEIHPPMASMPCTRHGARSWIPSWSTRPRRRASMSDSGCQSLACCMARETVRSA